MKNTVETERKPWRKNPLASGSALACSEHLNVRAARCSAAQPAACTAAPCNWEASLTSSLGLLNERSEVQFSVNFSITTSLLDMVIISTAWVAYRSQTNRPNYWDLGRCKYFVFKITQSKMSQRTFSPRKDKRRYSIPVWCKSPRSLLQHILMDADLNAISIRLCLKEHKDFSVLIQNETLNKRIYLPLQSTISTAKTNPLENPEALQAKVFSTKKRNRIYSGIFTILKLTRPCLGTNAASPVSDPRRDRERERKSAGGRRSPALGQSARSSAPPGGTRTDLGTGRDGTGSPGPARRRAAPLRSWPPCAGWRRPLAAPHAGEQRRAARPPSRCVRADSGARPERGAGHGRALLSTQASNHAVEDKTTLRAVMLGSTNSSSAVL